MTLEAGEHAQWVQYKGSAFDQSDVFKEGPMSMAEAKAIVEKNLGEVIGFSWHSGYPEYRWVVRKGTAKIPFQAGWTCAVYKVKLPTAKETQLFQDDFAFTPKAFGSMDFGLGWARPGRGEGLGDQLTDVDMIQGVDPNDMQQGGLGDCWLISSFAALSEFPSQVCKLVEPNTIAKDGKYTVNLYDYSQKKVVPVVVDDRIPLGQGGLPRFTGFTKDDEIWPCIFEKAVAKLAGSYENIDGADPAFALGMLTGTPSSDLVEFMLNQGSWICLVPDFRSSNPHDKSNGMFYKNWPDGTSGDQGRPGSTVLKLLAEYDQKNYLMCCGSHAGSDKDLNSFGVVQGHAYTIIAVELNVAGSGFDMLMLRNPWGTGEWTGDWSDQSDMWTRYPNVKKTLGYEFADDGIFWIEASDFFKNYSSVMVCCKSMPKSRAKNAKEEKAKRQKEEEEAKKKPEAAGKEQKAKPPPPKRPVRKTEQAKKSIMHPKMMVEIPGPETITVEGGARATVSRPPGLSLEEWEVVKKTLKEKPEEATKMEAFCKDTAAVRKWLSQKALTEYYQSKLYERDGHVKDALLGLFQDPQFAFIFEEMQRNGVEAALKKYGNNATMMQRLSKAVGGVPVEVMASLVHIQEKPVTLHDACKMGDLKAIQEYVAAGEKAGKLDLEVHDSKGIAALAYAIGANRIAIVKLLLEKKANLSVCDSKGGTGLHYAAAYGRKELTEFLLGAGGLVNGKTEHGLTPLALATKNKREDVIELLKKKGGTM
mmetsp:Transcript_43880/g.121994  ORF Transcript_43880/g.121994 Transcript_43880/m.121994 type:complete len:759 (-) Transcript_43880:115-2391(-)